MLFEFSYLPPGMMVYDASAFSGSFKGSCTHKRNPIGSLKLKVYMIKISKALLRWCEGAVVAAGFSKAKQSKGVRASARLYSH